MTDIILLIIGFIAGVIAGFFIGKSKTYQSADLSSQIGAIGGLKTQITELKAKFETIEKSREKFDSEREKRFEDFVKNYKEMLGQLIASHDKSDIEKEKRIKEIVESSKEFFNEQRESTEKFLQDQGKSRDEIEKRRDAQFLDMKNTLSKFTQTISGTQKMGKVGESLLENVLKNSIRAGAVIKDLKVGSKKVEFAWDLGDGKYIPIDSKFPDVFETYDEYLKTEDYNERLKLKKIIKNKIMSNIKEVQKYQNQGNTIDNCIVVIPPALIEVCPEIVGEGKDFQVFVCSYTDVFPIANILHEQYSRMKQEGDVGQYKKMVEQLFGILDRIMSKTESIDKALSTITNANNDIKEEVGKSKRI